MCIKPEKYLIRVTAKSKTWKKKNSNTRKLEGVGRTNPLWHANTEVTANNNYPRKIQKTADFITVVA